MFNLRTIHELNIDDLPKFFFESRPVLPELLLVKFPIFRTQIVIREAQNN